MTWKQISIMRDIGSLHDDYDRRYSKPWCIHMHNSHIQKQNSLWVWHTCKCVLPSYTCTLGSKWQLHEKWQLEYINIHSATLYPQSTNKKTQIVIKCTTEWPWIKQRLKPWVHNMEVNMLRYEWAWHYTATCKIILLIQIKWVRHLLG